MNSPFKKSFDENGNVVEPELITVNSTSKDSKNFLHINFLPSRKQRRSIDKYIQVYKIGFGWMTIRKSKYNLNSGLQISRSIEETKEYYEAKKLRKAVNSEIKRLVNEKADTSTLNKLGKSKKSSPETKLACKTLLADFFDYRKYLEFTAKKETL